MAALERVAALDGPLAEILERGRERFNARYAQAALYNRRLDPQRWAEHLATVVDPLVRSVAGADKDQVERVTEVLYDLSLELLGADLFARYRAVRKAWLEILPRLPALLLASPRIVVAAISNGAFNLAREQPDAAGPWLDDMLAIAPLCDTPELFLEAGKVLAWRWGLAHYRVSAIRAWLALPDALAAQVLPEIDVQADRAALFDALCRPWVDQPKNKARLNLVMQVGAFRGFDGQFIRPPRVFADPNQLYIHDQHAWWTLHADRYGSTLKRFGSSPPAGLVEQPGTFSLGKDIKVREQDIEPRFPALCEITSIAGDGETLAITLAHSHSVFLLAPGTALLAFEPS